MLTRRRLNFTLIIFGFTLGLCMSLLTKVAAADPSEGASNVAFNSDGKGEVMVSCNGKTYKGQGMAACTSSASCFENSLVGLVLLIVVPLFINYTARN